MSQTLPMPRPGFDALSVEEQIDYVQSLWDHIAARLEQIPVPEWHHEILTERLEAYRHGQDKGRDWDEFEQDVISELKRPPVK